MRKIILLSLLLMLNTITNAQNCLFSFSQNSTTTITFNAQSTFGGINYVVNWDFGDGTTGIGANVSHTYAQAGVYTVVSTVIDITTGVTVCSSTQLITFTGTGTCSYTYTNAGPTGNPLVLTFTSNTSSPNNLVSWDFGDGTPIIYGTNPTHTYSIAGTYAVCMTAYNAIDTCTYCDSIVVNSSSANCTFTLSPDPINIYAFTFQGVGSATNSIINWTFGDGNIATGDTVNHTYSQAGTYQVCMIETDNFTGQTICSICYNITINPNQLCTFDTLYQNGTNNIITFSPSQWMGGYTYFWDFGDGMFDSTIVTPTHTYVIPGTYQACLTTYLNGVLICTTCKPINISSANICSFTYAYTSAVNTILFTSTSSPNNLCVWDFGDGTQLIGPQVAHQYSAPGTYNVCMTVTSALGGTCTTCQTIVIGSNTLCLANFTAVSIGFNAYFIDQSSVFDPTMGPLPAPIYYSWNFGDGTTSTLQFPNHQYASTGTYNVCLTINSIGCTSNYCQTIVIDTSNVLPLTCNAFFVFSQTSPYSLLAVNLSSGINLNFNWDFGDGNTATGAYPSHTYTSTGSYLICLTVSDANGCSDTYCDSLTVDSTGNIIYRGTTVGFTLNVVSPAQITSSIKEIEQASVVTVFPNPSNDWIQIKLEGIAQATYTAYIRNIEGKTVLNQMLQTVNDKIDVSAIQTGTYIIELISDKGKHYYSLFNKQ